LITEACTIPIGEDPTGQPRHRPPVILHFKILCTFSQLCRCYYASSECRHQRGIVPTVHPASRILHEPESADFLMNIDAMHLLWDAIESAKEKRSSQGSSGNPGPGVAFCRTPVTHENSFLESWCL
jgi:hypothetical protein